MMEFSFDDLYGTQHNIRLTHRSWNVKDCKMQRHKKNTKASAMNVIIISI